MWSNSYSSARSVPVRITTTGISTNRWRLSSTGTVPPPVRTVIHRVLVDGTPFRTATQDLEVRNVDGVRIGTTAGQFLDELNAQDDG